MVVATFVVYDLVPDQTLSGTLFEAVVGEFCMKVIIDPNFVSAVLDSLYFGIRHNAGRWLWSASHGGKKLA